MNKKTIFLTSLFFLSLSSQTLLAKTGALFTVTKNGTDLVVTPTANHYYPSMGIQISSGQSVTGCTPSSNGFCLFSASKAAPGALVLNSSDGIINGTVCLNGLAQYSCQRFNTGGDQPAHPLASCGDGPGSGPCGVFVTSIQYTGNLNNLPGAGGVIDKVNAECARLAMGKFPGVWRGWLSTRTENAKDNIAYGTATERMYVRATNPTAVVSQSTQGALLAQPLTAPILLDELGVQHLGFPDSAAWTGTTTTGEYHNPPNICGPSGNQPCDCADWTDASPSPPTNAGIPGESDSTLNAWTVSGLFLCSSPSRLYCFQVPAP